MTSHTIDTVRGVLAPLTLVSADGAVTLLHVLVQMNLSQMRGVAYVELQVESSFTWEAHE